MIFEKQVRWVSPKKLEGSFHSAGGLITEMAGWERAYDIWDHAKDILSGPQIEAYLADAITNLKRAVNHRLSSLQEAYHFDQIPDTGKPRRILEQLAYWDIVRPTMLKELIDIRNAIEHENAPPPNQQRCLEFLDFVWYFLRSTDFLCASIPGDLESDAPEYPISITLNSTSPWEIELSAWLRSSDVSEVEIPGWIRISSTIYHTGLSAKEIRDDPEAQALNDDDLLIKGTILGPAALIGKMARLFLTSRPFASYSSHL